MQGLLIKLLEITPKDPIGSSLQQLAVTIELNKAPGIGLLRMMDLSISVVN